MSIIAQTSFPDIAIYLYTPFIQPRGYRYIITCMREQCTFPFPLETPGYEARLTID